VPMSGLIGVHDLMWRNGSMAEVLV